jgi:hypothetical protein
MKIAIIIPIYRDPNKKEEISLKQSCKVLGLYDTILVTPCTFNAEKYISLWKSYNLKLQIEKFADEYFVGISSYNRLLLSSDFYSRFASYDYMLICQPDAYVFEDKLKYWCEKDYDYIGAPLVGKFSENVYYSEMPMRVGNGGFSLRKISKCLDFFNGKKNVFTSKQITKNINLWKKPHTRFFVWFLMLCGWRNKPNSVAQHWNHNEDDFWSGYLDNSNYSLSKPQPIEALDFAFERFPSEMYKLNDCKLPFGCHAWEKYEYESFWKQFIK